MSENEVKEKKPRGRLWLVFGAGFVLFIVYQLGYSSGARSALELPRDIHSVVESSSAPVSVPVSQSQPVKVAKPAKPPTVAAAVQQSLPVVIETPSVQALSGSAYDRRPAPTKSSELGLIPLQPLEPVPVSVHAEALPKMNIPSVATFRPGMQLPMLQVRSPSECDCGKEH